jgi:hypothetical protein
MKEHKIIYTKLHTLILLAFCVQKTIRQKERFAFVVSLRKRDHLKTVCSRHQKILCSSTHTNTVGSRFMTGLHSRIFGCKSN